VVGTTRTAAACRPLTFRKHAAGKFGHVWDEQAGPAELTGRRSPFISKAAPAV
jgi:hypothetical protein